VVERTIRPIALNRKNARFAGSYQGGAHWGVRSIPRPMSPTSSAASSTATPPARATSSCPGPTLIADPVARKPRLRRRGGRKLIMTPEGTPMPAPKPRCDDTLIKALVRAHRWRRKIESGQAKSITDVAEQEGRDGRLRVSAASADVPGARHHRRDPGRATAEGTHAGRDAWLGGSVVDRAAGESLAASSSERTILAFPEGSDKWERAPRGLLSAQMSPKRPESVKHFTAIALPVSYGAVETSPISVSESPRMKVRGFGRCSRGRAKSRVGKKAGRRP
jgi:hypothetical protein